MRNSEFVYCVGAKTSQLSLPQADPQIPQGEKEGIDEQIGAITDLALTGLGDSVNINEGTSRVSYSNPGIYSANL